MDASINWRLPLGGELTFAAKLTNGSNADGPAVRFFGPIIGFRQRREAITDTPSTPAANTKASMVKKGAVKADHNSIFH